MLLVGLCMGVLCAGALSGCGGSGYKKADSTTSSMNALKNELLSGKDQVAKTMTALNQVVDTAGKNPRPAYEKFKKGFTNTQKQAAKVRSRANEMNKQGQAYFKKWETEFKKVASPEMKQRFEQRKTVLADQYKKIQEYAQLVKTDYGSFIQNLSDIQLVLGVDLTPKGVESVTDVISRANRDAQGIYGHIDTYVSILDQVSAEMSPGKK